MRPSGRAAALALLLVLGSRCGKKGDPQPPLHRGPSAVSDLSVEQEGAAAVLTFTFPDRLLTGQPLTDLQAIEIHRAVGPSPAITAPRKSPSGGGPAGDQAPAAAARRAAANLRLAEEAFYAESERIARLPLPALSRHTQGATIRYEDPVFNLLAKEEAPLPLAYAVVSVREKGERSPLSNIALLSPDVPPGPPVILRVTPEEGRICLEWLPPEKDLLGRPAEVGGYRVYRRTLPDEEYAVPLNAEPVAGTTFVDSVVPYGAEHVYTVRATQPGKPRVEGLPAEEVGLLYRDVFPPPAPARLDALPEGNLVRLLWNPASVPDLAGYLIFRAVGSGEPVPLTEAPIGETFYIDSAVTPGKRYRYTIRAVDTAGNRSASSQETVAEPL